MRSDLSWVVGMADGFIPVMLNQDFPGLYMEGDCPPPPSLFA